MSKNQIMPERQLGGVIPSKEIQTPNEFYQELEKIHFKYERLHSIISILQMFTAETAGNIGVPSGSLSNALLEIEMGMGEANSRLESIFMQKGGAA